MDHRTAAVFVEFSMFAFIIIIIFLVQSLVYQHYVFSMVFLRIFKIFLSDMKQIYDKIIMILNSN